MAAVQFKSGGNSLYKDHFKSNQVKSCDDLFAAIDVSIRCDPSGVAITSLHLYYIHFESSYPL